MPTLICVPITVRDDTAAIRDAILAAESGADLVEFRIDEIFDPDMGDVSIDEFVARVARLMGQSPRPCIVTCRTASEGGAYEGGDSPLLALMQKLAALDVDGHPARYVDVEAAVYGRTPDGCSRIKRALDPASQARDLKTSLVLSFHDFRGRPADLYRKIASMQEHDCASVIKVAFLARSIRDAIEALHLPSTISRPTIALAMGDFGIMSRILAPKFGAFLTFATLRPALATAPGQPTLSELLNVYNFRRINPRTAVYGIVGWPVAHSKSPLVHNAGFLKIGFDGVYVPMPVVHGDDAESGYASFKASLLELLGDDRLTFRGCSVTLPHKENLVRLAHEMGWLIDPLARRAGAGNTLVVHEDGTRVLNTDVAAVISCVRSYFTSPPRQVLLLGAGGAARAAGVAMREMGALVRVASRTAEKASRLCTEMGAGWSAASWEDPLAIEDQLVVQCTPLGMLGGPDASANPLAESSLQRLHVPVFETVYTPRETPFVKAALSRGVHAIYGRDMFIQQARLQFEAWTGQQAPLDVFQEALNSGA